MKAKVLTPGSAPPARRLPLLGLMLLALPAFAQELTFESSRPGLPVQLSGRYEVRALTPFSLDEQGDSFTKIRVGGRGFEYKVAGLAWDQNMRPVLRSRHRRNSIIGFILPGMGSFLSGRRMHGFIELAGVGYLIGATVKTSLDRDAMGDEAVKFSNLAMSEGDVDLRKRLLLRSEMSSSRHELLEDQFRMQSNISAAYAIVLGCEGWWLNRSLHATTRSRQIFLRVPRLSRAKAVFASFMFPGLGQAYRGQRRSLLYTAAEIYLLQELLDSHLRFESHESDYKLTWDYLAEDGFLDGEDEAELGRIRECVNQAEQDRKLFAGLAGAIWLINVVDAIVGQPVEVPDGREARLALALSPAGRPGLAWTCEF